MTRENARSGCIISLSTPVVEGLIIPRVEPIRIRRTIAIHDPIGYIPEILRTQRTWKSPVAVTIKMTTCS